jgi:hypothetical protein
MTRTACLVTSAICAVGAVACSGGSSESAAEATVQGDVMVLQEILGTDPARVILGEVDHAVDSDRPVMAADLIDDAALPAVGRQIERLEEAEVGTTDGRRLRTRAVRLYRARATALETYRDALARGAGTEDMTLLDAIRAYGDAEAEITTLHDELARIRPLAPGALEHADREAALGGLPPIGRETATEDPDQAPEVIGAPDPRAGEPTEPLPETEPEGAPTGAPTTAPPRRP